MRQRRNALDPGDLPAAVLLLDFALLDGDDAAIGAAADRLRPPSTGRRKASTFGLGCASSPAF